MKVWNILFKSSYISEECESKIIDSFHFMLENKTEIGKILKKNKKFHKLLKKIYENMTLYTSEINGVNINGKSFDSFKEILFKTDDSKLWDIIIEDVSFLLYSSVYVLLCYSYDVDKIITDIRITDLYTRIKFFNKVFF